MLPPAQEVEVEMLRVGPKVEVRYGKPSVGVARAVRRGAVRVRVHRFAQIEQFLRRHQLGAHSIVDNNRQPEPLGLPLERARRQGSIVLPWRSAIHGIP
jgi:hypothetical protein